MIRLIIADDHELFRDGIRHFLAGEDGIEVVGEAGTGKETLDICRKLNPDILLLDLNMPDMDGLDVIQALKSEKLDIRILVITMYNNEEYAVRVLQMGVAGYMVKYSSSGVLLHAIEEIMAGKVFMPENMKNDITLKMLNGTANLTTKLSDRELQVFIGLANGKTNKEIAADLGVSPKTVDTHRSRLMTKLGIKNIVDLVKVAIREGIIEQY